MNPDLKMLFDALRESTEGLAEAQLAWHPEGKWCIAEVLEHLNMTYAATTKGLELRLAQGAKAGNRTLKNAIQQFVVLDVGYFPHGRKAPAVAAPQSVPDCAKIVSTTLNNLEIMAKKIEEAQTKFGPKDLIMDHPVLGPFTVPQWPRFHRVHGLHHVKQIENLKRSMPPMARAANG
jgi:hypothetical protein